jgi:hypothetical protein
MVYFKLWTWAIRGPLLLWTQKIIAKNIITYLKQCYWNACLQTMCHNNVPMVSLRCPYIVPMVSLRCPYAQEAKLHTTKALCPSPNALRPTPLALCPTHNPFALRPTWYALRPTTYTLCRTSYVLRSTHYVLSHHPKVIHPTPNAQAQFPKSNAIHMSSYIYCSIRHT